MTNYRRGYEIERKLVNELREHGWTAVRSAGSHSPFDVVAVAFHKIRLIQCKRTKKFTSLTQFNTEIRELHDLQVPDDCSKEFWVWQDKKGWVMSTELRDYDA
jgi:Holliday junction resolvase